MAVSDGITERKTRLARDTDEEQRELDYKRMCSSGRKPTDLKCFNEEIDQASFTLMLEVI